MDKKAQEILYDMLCRNIEFCSMMYEMSAKAREETLKVDDFFVADDNPELTEKMKKRMKEFFPDIDDGLDPDGGFVPDDDVESPEDRIKQIRDDINKFALMFDDSATGDSDNQ